MNFITIDGHPPVNLDRIYGFVASEGDNCIYFRFASGHLKWAFSKEKDRNAAYDFLIRKSAIRYSRRDKLTEIIKEKIKAGKEHFVSLVKKRRKDFSTPQLEFSPLKQIAFGSEQTQPNKKKRKPLRNWSRAINEANDPYLKSIYG